MAFQETSLLPPPSGLYPNKQNPQFEDSCETKVETSVLSYSRTRERLGLT
jgi:hypothetical protein